VSYALKNFLNANGIGNVEVIYNGIKVEDFETKIDEVVEFKKRYNLFNKKIIFFGGRVSKSKGAEKILEAMRLIVKMAKDAMLVIAGGGGNYLNHLKNLSQKLNINDYVLFLGQVPHNQMRIIYDAADIVVVPSLYLDPFPTVNLEAMACKKPVVGTCFGGTPEIVQDGVTGYIINPFNVEEMVEKIVDLLENPEKAKQFGEAGYKRVRDDFSLDKQLETMLRWYNKV
jgi:glycosyltransferase involved in cell wall biosynthesis